MAEWLAGESQSGIHVKRSESLTVLRIARLRRGDSTKPAMYAMWGRALSDGCFYPIAPSVYTLALTLLEERNGNTQRYQWKARTHGHMTFNIPVAMQEVAAHWTGNEARLAVSGPVAPELVEAGWPLCTPTVFYPGGSLWTPDRLEEGEFD